MGLRVYHTDYPTCVTRTQWGANDLHTFDQEDLGDLANCDETGKADGYLWVWDAGAGKWKPKAVGTAIDHGALSGLADDDHPQYLKEKASGGLASEIPTHDHSAAAEAGTVDHGDLDGLADNDHTQYQLTSEKGAANGYMGLDASQVGTDPPQAHKDRHDPEDGADPLDCGAPSSIGTANAEGSAHAFARQDHVHDVAGQAGQSPVLILLWDYQSVGQGNWTFLSQASWSAWPWYNSSNGDGDNLSFNRYLAAGTYTIRAVYSQATARGILDIDIDGVEVASLDMYGPPAVNQIATDTGNVVSTPGLKTIRLRVDGKHASSTHYYVVINAIEFWRTA